MAKVVSKDGTEIAFTKVGSGEPLILVDGATCYRELGPMKKLAAELSKHFTVYYYDRRGRGESGNTLPYSPDREIEDLEAVIAAAGGRASVYGVSSGAALALDAANSLSGIEKLVLYEAPFIVDDSRDPVPEDFIPETEELVAAGRRGDAVKKFLRLVGLPSVFIHLMPIIPGWKKLKGVAHTLPYDLQIVEENQRGTPLKAERWKLVDMPTLVGVGGKSPKWMRNAMGQLAGTLPNAELRLIAGQTHMIGAKILAPIITEFVGKPGTSGEVTREAAIA
jgi:pimeloyl-ACP methyl ester carboxylesterase